MRSLPDDYTFQEEKLGEAKTSRLSAFSKQFIPEIYQKTFCSSTIEKGKKVRHIISSHYR